MYQRLSENLHFVCLHLSSDINECTKDIHNCTSGCNNTEGSYYCTCPGGYQLGDDSYTCFGELIIISFYSGLALNM